jgi:hypothetical protein
MVAMHRARGAHHRSRDWAGAIGGYDQAAPDSFSCLGLKGQHA